jgi:hypothetical protein
MHLVMEEEVRHLAGERHQQHPARRAHRWGKEDGYCVGSKLCFLSMPYPFRLILHWKRLRLASGGGLGVRF